MLPEASDDRQIARLRSELKNALAAAERQRIKAKSARQLLTRIQARHRAGDHFGAEWLIENWQDQLQKWADEAKARSRT
ncbi:hypothetical protein ACIQTT_01770 [Microbacterium sp. NPDC090225]|uniref:hypothetical protein n=1 Tax=Microbacterium sp. NPDC090225 TaxID=3364207 RepID=UPI0038073741